jgi:hypothetical protein
VADLRYNPPDSEPGDFSDRRDAQVDAEQARATAEYLTDMIAQLESMARGGGLDLVAYLLAMARVEADSNARILAHGTASRPMRF